MMDSPGIGTIRMMVCEGQVCNPGLAELDAKIPHAEGRMCSTKNTFDVVMPISEALASQLRGLVHTPHVDTHAPYVNARWACSVCQHARR